MNTQDTSTTRGKLPLSDETLQKIRYVYHTLEAFQQTPAHIQAKAKLCEALSRPLEKEGKTAEEGRGGRKPEN